MSTNFDWKSHYAKPTHLLKKGDIMQAGEGWLCIDFARTTDNKVIPVVQIDPEQTDRRMDSEMFFQIFGPDRVEFIAGKKDTLAVYDAFQVSAEGTPVENGFQIVIRKPLHTEIPTHTPAA